MLRFVANLSELFQLPHASVRKSTRDQGLKYQNLEARHLLASITYSPATDIVTMQGDAAGEVGEVFVESANELRFKLTGLSDFILDTSVDPLNEIRFFGGDGDDVFSNFTSYVSVAYGEAGNDELNGGSANDFLFGGVDNDTLRGFDGSDGLHGNEGDDTILGGEGNDFLYGFTGADSLYGGAGNDQIIGDMGNDVIYAGDGDDDVFGSEGNDIIKGEGGSDDLFGQDGDDYIEGNEDDDNIFGGEGEDIILGGEGNDDIYGNDDDDKLYGEAGDDTIVGHSGEDLIFGGTGDECKIEHTTGIIIDAIQIPWVVIPIGVDQLDGLNPPPNVIFEHV